MDIEVSPNKARIDLRSGQSFNFPAKFLRAKKYGIKKLPPCPFGSPVARLLNHCYWMFEYTAQDKDETIGLQGPSPTGAFVAVKLEVGQHFFVNTRYLAGFSSDVHFKTKIFRIFSPVCWILGHPLPVVASGPGMLLFYADEGMHWDDNHDPHQWGFIPNQVIGFDATQPFKAEVSKTDRNLLSQIVNAWSMDYRWTLPRGQKVLVGGVNRPSAHGGHLIRHLLFHAVILGISILLVSIRIGSIFHYFNW